MCKNIEWPVSLDSRRIASLYMLMKAVHIAADPLSV